MKQEGLGLSYFSASKEMPLVRATVRLFSFPLRVTGVIWEGLRLIRCRGRGEPAGTELT